MPRKRGYTRKSWPVIPAYDRKWNRQGEPKGGQKVRSSKARVGAAGRTGDEQIIEEARRQHYALLAYLNSLPPLLPPTR